MDIEELTSRQKKALIHAGYTDSDIYKLAQEEVDSLLPEVMAEYEFLGNINFVIHGRDIPTFFSGGTCVEQMCCIVTRGGAGDVVYAKTMEDAIKRAFDDARAHESYMRKECKSRFVSLPEEVKMEDFDDRPDVFEALVARGYCTDFLRHLSLGPTRMLIELHDAGEHARSNAMKRLRNVSRRRYYYDCLSVQFFYDYDGLIFQFNIADYSFNHSTSNFTSIDKFANDFALFAIIGSIEGIDLSRRDKHVHGN